MAASDAKPYPIKGQAYRVTFPILDNDGDLVTGAAGLDSEISKDAGTFSDCTNEATEVATNSGMYYLDLTATEMNADTVAIIVKTSTANAKTTPIVLYPVEDSDIRVNTVQIESADATDQIKTAAAGALADVHLDHLAVRSGAAQGGGSNTITLDAGASSVDDFYKCEVICLVGGMGAGQTGGVLSYVGATKVLTVDRNWATNPDATTVFVIFSTYAVAVQALCEAALAAKRLHEILAAQLSAPPASGSLVDDLTEDDAGVQRFNANALEEAPTGGTNPNVLLSTTVATVVSQTELTLAAGSNDDGAYYDQGVVLYDGSEGDNPSVRRVRVYTAATKTIKIDKAPDFTVATGDGVKIFVTTVPLPAGAGAIEWTYALTEEGTGNPIADADIWVTSDAAGTDILASGRTDQNGEVVFMLDEGQVYIWRQKTGWNFTNPDIETVSE